MVDQNPHKDFAANEQYKADSPVLLDILILTMLHIFLRSAYFFKFFYFFLIFILYGSIVDLQCCVSFRCTAK